MNGNVIHRPLPIEDPKWNGTSIVISEKDIRSPIFDEKDKKQNWVPIKISSNTNPIIHNISLIGIPIGDDISKKEVVIPIANYHTVPGNSKVIIVPRPADELYDLSKKFDLFLDVHNPVGKSRLPITVMPKKLLDDQTIILWIILPIAVVVVFASLIVLIFKAYR